MPPSSNGQRRQFPPGPAHTPGGTAPLANVAGGVLSAEEGTAVGKWRLSGDHDEWRFDDDTPAYRRKFRVKETGLKFVSKGHVLPEGQGFFEMEKAV